MKYTIKCKWPEKTTIQYGNYLNKKYFIIKWNDYNIRTEASTYKKAENKAFDIFVKQQNCHHSFVPNGQDEVCEHCSYIKKQIFSSKSICNVCQKPNALFSYGNTHLCLNHFANAKNLIPLHINTDEGDIQYLLSNIAKEGLKHNKFTGNESKDFSILYELSKEHTKIENIIHSKILTWIRQNVELYNIPVILEKLDSIMNEYSAEIINLIFQYDEKNINKILIEMQKLIFNKIKQ